MGNTIYPRKENLLAATTLKNHLLGRAVTDITVFKEKNSVRLHLNDGTILVIEMKSEPGADGGLYQWLTLNIHGKDSHKELLRT